MRKITLLLILSMIVVCASAQYYHYGGRTAMRPVMLPSVRSVRHTTIVVVKRENMNCHSTPTCQCQGYSNECGNSCQRQNQRNCGQCEGEEQRGFETCVGWTINFDIGSFSIATNVDAHTNIINIVNYAKKYPNSIFNVYGYADANTGSQQANMRLAEKRCDLICSILVNGYNIDPSRINKKSYGSDEQIYRKNNYNRCVYVESFK